MHRYLMVPVLAFAGFTTSAATADTTTVCASGCDFTSIQAAIDAANDGDVINLTDSVYNEGAEIDMRGKAITLKGQTQGGTAITCIESQYGYRIIACRSGETSATVLQNLYFSYGLGEGLGGGGLLIEGSSPTIENCTFLSNQIEFGMFGGGVLVNGGSPKFIKTYFSFNGPFLSDQVISGGGLAVINGGHVTMESPYFLQNRAQAGGGLYVGSGSSASLSVTLNEFVNFVGNKAYALDSVNLPGEQPGLGGGIANFGDITIQGASSSGKGVFEFVSNVADGISGMPGLGGGIYHDGTSLVMSLTSFTLNHADKGGGVYTVTSGVDLESVVFTINSPNGVAGAPGSSPGLRGQPPVIAVNSCKIYANGDGEIDQQIDGLLVMHLGDNHISKHPPLSDCPSDLNGDGQVDAADLGLLLSAWGFCGTP